MYSCPICLNNDHLPQSCRSETVMRYTTLLNYCIGRDMENNNITYTTRILNVYKTHSLKAILKNEPIEWDKEKDYYTEYVMSTYFEKNRVHYNLRQRVLTFNNVRNNPYDLTCEEVIELYHLFTYTNRPSHNHLVFQKFSNFINQELLYSRDYSNYRINRLQLLYGDSASLPVNPKSFDFEEKDCPICYLTFDKQQIIETSCGHYMCKTCYNSYIKTYHTKLNVPCHYCRTQLSAVYCEMNCPTTNR